jgi:hypothetical protein
MMRTIRASRVARLVLLLALFSLALAIPSAAYEHQVSCQGYYERDVTRHLVSPGDIEPCWVHGLNAELEARWKVVFFSLETGEPLGEPASGTLAPRTPQFEFRVPDDQVWFEGIVLQGLDDAPSYEARFFGTTDWVAEGLVVCGPPKEESEISGELRVQLEPVVRGGTLRCVVAGLLKPGYDWRVVFTGEGMEDLAEAGGSGDGGFCYSFCGAVGSGQGEYEGSFTITVPRDERIVTFVAVAEQPRFVASYEGTVIAPAPQPAPQPSQSSPVVVVQPTRVDTGAGGSAPTGADPAIMLGLLGVALGLGALRWRARTTD